MTGGSVFRSWAELRRGRDGRTHVRFHGGKVAAAGLQHSTLFEKRVEEEASITREREKKRYFCLPV